MDTTSKYPPADVFLDAVFKTIRGQVKEQQQTHPEDIMTTVSLMAETIYQFVSNIPEGYGILKYQP